jgi:hypothetical protein
MQDFLLILTHIASRSQKHCYVSDFSIPDHWLTWQVQEIRHTVFLYMFRTTSGMHTDNSVEKNWLFHLLTMISTCDLAVKWLLYIILLDRNLDPTVSLNIHIALFIILRKAAWEDKHHNNGHPLTFQWRYRHVVKVQLYPFSASVLERGGRPTTSLSHCILSLCILGDTEAEVVKEAGWASGQSGWVWRRENLFPKPGFKSQTVQPVAGHYTNYTILALHHEYK